MRPKLAVLDIALMEWAAVEAAVCKKSLASSHHKVTRHPSFVAGVFLIQHEWLDNFVPKYRTH